ncbi:MAG: tRNA (N6-threonylcarbamoyladenosine(37)-N6)-methyltransferase TrmO [Alphaproteobacteria bacterium]|nr:MAG: tRNA (N6-threonylcarbamoyladenosine(37)-N6)-methyltransferase TrmO [Alphaproteobacteria bacterium]
MATHFTMTAIGHVDGGRGPAEDDRWGGSRAAIILDGLPDAALLGLDGFSHCEVIFVFDRLPEAEITIGARRPRGNPDWPLVGILAQRGRNRPNRIGVSICRVIAVAGSRLEVEGLDAIDGTPVLDIKPVLSGFLPRSVVREPDWARAIMADYW